MQFQKDFPVQWANLDPNGHVRHTVYSHYASETRIAFYIYFKLMPDFLKAKNIGPILFREEILYRSETKLGEIFNVNCLLTGISENASKIDIKNEIRIKSSKKIAAVINSTTMWLDLETRKLTQPPKEVVEAFVSLDRENRSSGSLVQPGINK